MPEIIRENFLRSKLLEANFERENVSFQFYTSDEPLILQIGAEIRGNGNPLPILAAICVPNGWIAINDADKSVVGLGADNSPDWDRFCKWRDNAIKSLSSDTVDES